MILNHSEDMVDFILSLPIEMQKEINAENDEDYQDFWYGVECGSYFGLPNKESLRKSNEAMELFMNQMKYGFVHEVIEANNLA